MTLSNSTKIDLEEMGFKKLFVVPPSLNVRPLLTAKKKEANCSFCRQAKKSKLPHHALHVLSSINHEIPDAKM